MKAKLPNLILLVILLAIGLSATARTQITFTRMPVRSSAANEQQGQQPQKGLPPEKKKSLSKYGPEDAFPGAREQENEPNESKRAASRQQSSPANPRPSPTPVSVSTTSLIATPTPVAEATISLTTSNPVAPAATPKDVIPSSSGGSWSSGIIPVTLSTAALLVFGALIYVVGMLRKKLFEGDKK